MQTEKQSTEMLKVQQLLQIPHSFMKRCQQPNTNKQFILLCERKETVSLQLSTSCMPPFAYAREGF